MSYRDADYCTSDELADYLRDSTGVDDDQLALAVTAASRAIDRACGRAFGLDDSATTREYTIGPGAICTIDDVQTSTGLVVKSATPWPSTTWTTLVLDTDFRMRPVNAAADGRPWERIYLAQATVATRLQVTATFGWSSIPDTITQAALLQASRFFHRRDSPFGVAGSPDLGSELRLLERVDPDVMVMIASYARRWAAV